MATATLKKTKATIPDETTNLVRFRTKHRDDKGKAGRSMARFTETHLCEDGSLYTIRFDSVGHEIQKLVPAFCHRIFSRDEKFPADLKDKKLAGTSVYDYLKNHPQSLSRDIFEDASYNIKKDFGEQASSELEIAKAVETKRVLLEDEMKAKEVRLKELEAKEKGEK